MKRLYYFTSFLLLSGILVKCNLENSGNNPLKMVIPFNEDWEFIVDPDNAGEESDWKSGLPENKVKKVTVPHTWNSMPEYEEYTGKGWYQKAFHVDEEWVGKPVYLKFGAVYRDVQLWLNGQLILTRIGSGYTPFKVRLTDYLKSGENLIVLCVDNRFSPFALPYQKKFDWSNDGGITRNVVLVKSEAPSIDRVALTPSITGNSGKIKLKLVLNESEYASLSIWVQVKEENQKTEEVVFNGNLKIKISDRQGYATIDIPGIKTWHFDQPNLYNVRLAVGYGTMLTDNFEANIGFREFNIHGDKIVFNGEAVRLPGIEWMPGSNPLYGMAEPEEEIHKMLNLMKDVNAVFTRFHWQQDEAVFDWCDRNGILVQEEIPYWQAPYPDQLNDSLKQIISNQIREMIEAHYNHPSIFAWGIGNELQGQNDGMKSYLKELIHEIRKIDTTRIINYVSNTMHHDPLNDAAILGDWPAWNDYSGYWYQGRDGSGLGEDDLEAVLDNMHLSIPDKPIMISEYGLCEPVFKGGDPERIRHFNFHTGMFETKPFVAGVVYFSLNDYRTHMGEEGKGKFRQRVHGIVDLNRIKKPSYATVKNAFSPIRNLKIEMRDNAVHVRGNNAAGIPTYTLRGYYILSFDANNDAIGPALNIPDLKPGDPFNQVIRSAGSEIRQICIYRPTGFIVKSIKVE